MKFTFDDLNKQNGWLVDEIMSSLTSECYTEQVMKDEFFDIKLSINGNLIEPVLYNNIMSRIEIIINNQANLLLKNKLEEATNEIDVLKNMVTKLTENISDKYNLDRTDYL